MKIKKKHLNWKSGFIRFNYFEINWSMIDWALPFAICAGVGGRLLFIHFLFISLIISTDFKKL